MEGLMLLQQSIGKEKRPLTWVTGPQEVVRAEKPSMRDLKRAARRASTLLRSPDEVE
jgi:NADH-quinone oxidoreductase subunit B